MRAALVLFGMLMLGGCSAFEAPPAEPGELCSWLHFGDIPEYLKNAMPCALPKRERTDACPDAWRANEWDLEERHSTIPLAPLFSTSAAEPHDTLTFIWQSSEWKVAHSVFDQDFVVEPTSPPEHYRYRVVGDPHRDTYGYVLSRSSRVRTNAYYVDSQSRYGQRDGDVIGHFVDCAQQPLAGAIAVLARRGDFAPASYRLATSYPADDGHEDDKTTNVSGTFFFSAVEHDETTTHSRDTHRLELWAHVEDRLELVACEDLGVYDATTYVLIGPLRSSDAYQAEGSSCRCLLARCD